MITWLKPVNVNEMVLRVGALLRRAQMISDRRQTIGNTVLEYDSMTVTAKRQKHGSAAKRIHASVQIDRISGKDIHPSAVNG